MAKLRDVRAYFQDHVKILDIILPKRKDRNNKRIGFVKVENEVTAKSLLEKLKNSKFMGASFDCQLAKSKNKTFNPGSSNEVEGRKTNLGKDKLSSDSKKIPQTTKILESSVGRDETSSPIELVDLLEDPLNFSLIEFSPFLLDGDILNDVLKEVGVERVKVKELSC